MRIIQLYKLGPEDPNWETRIDEAFNRVLEFATELRYKDCPTPGSSGKAFNRVVVNREFSLSDWQKLHGYGLVVVGRAIDGAKRHPQEVADSIDQAALNLRDVLAEFDLWLATTPKEKD